MSYLISKSLRDLAAFADAVDDFYYDEIEKGLPSIVRAGGGGQLGQSLRNLNATGRRSGREIALARKTGKISDGRRFDPNSLKAQVKANAPSINDRMLSRRYAAARTGMLSPTTSQSASPALLERGKQLQSKVRPDEWGGYTNRKAALDRVTARRQDLQRRMRPVNIKNGTAQRPAW